MIRPDIIPAKTLIFEYGSNGPIISQLKILNHSTIDKRFKIKTTKPQFYLTNPSEGIVSDEIYISIEMKCDKFMLEHRLKDKFQILIMDVNLYEQSQDWEKAPDKFILDISFMKKEEFSDSHIYQADSIIEKPLEQSVSERKLDALQKKFKEQAKLIEQYKFDINELQNEIEKNEFIYSEQDQKTDENIIIQSLKDKAGVPVFQVLIAATVAVIFGSLLNR
ncbi:hypothetical protein pb186bvf_018961 [Paramecium bursaria]